MKDDPEFIALRDHLVKVSPFASDTLRSFHTMARELAAQLKEKTPKPTQDVEVNRAENHEIERVKFEEEVKAEEVTRKVKRYDIREVK